MLRSGEDADKAPKQQLEAPLRGLGRKLMDGRLVADNELQLRNDIDHEPRVRSESLQKRVAPRRQFGFALPEKWPDQALKGLRQGRIWDVALVLVELAGGEEPARQNECLVQFIDDGGLADTGISGDQHQLRHPALDDAIEGGAQRFNLTLAPIKFLRNHEPVRHVLRAEREFLDPALRFPCSEASPQIALQAGCSLIATLRRLGEQLHDNLRHDAGHVLQPLGGRGRKPRDVAVHPLHRIRRAKRQRACKHLVKRAPQCIEIAPGVDRPVHSSGLLGCHIGKGAGDGFGRFGGLAPARELRGDTETREFDFSGHAIHDDVVRLDVLVHKPALVDLAESRRDVDGETQECPQFHGPVELALQRLATGILEHQHGPAALTDKLERPQRPRTVELVPQSIFMCETTDKGRMRALRDGPNRQYRPALPVGARTP